jgi:hypothetical protein
MPAYLPIPEGLEIPEGETFDLVTTYTVDGGQLYPLAVEGILFPQTEEGEEPEGEMEEGEMEEGEMKEGGPQAGGFMVAIEEAMGKGKR